MNRLEKDDEENKVINNRLKEVAPYTYRKDYTEQVLQQLNKNHLVIVTGVGGIGKTQLAANYIETYRKQYKVIGWINAGDVVSIQDSYFELAEKLSLPFSNNGFNQVAILQYIKNWLENNNQWIMVYDNVKEYKIIKDIIPNAPRGHIIITSQNAKWSSFNSIVEVKKLDKEEAIKFLIKRAEKEYEPEMEDLVETLGNFPLALEHAAAYVHKTPRSFSYYLKQFKEKGYEILNRAKEPEDYNNTIATTWEVAFNEIKDKCPDAIEFLYFISFLAPNDIPLEKLKLNDEDEFSIVQILRDDFKVDDIIENLLKYSLINCGNNCINIYKVVQIVIRHKLPEDSQKEWCNKILNMFIKVFEKDEIYTSNYLRFKCILPHAIQIIYISVELGNKNEELAIFCQLVGNLLIEAADYEKAIKIHKIGLNIANHVFDYKSKNIAICNSNLGVAEKISGNISEGLKYYNKAVNIYKKLNLENTVEYASLLSNIGRVKMDQGKYEESHQLILESFQIVEKLKTEYDIKNINILSNFALSLVHVGDVNNSIKCNRKILEILRKNKIKESEIMATCLNNLSTCLLKKERYNWAFILSRMAVQIDERIYGNSHPTVALYYSNLANLLIGKGDFVQARKYIIKSFKINRDIYGMKHYSIGKDMFNCSSILLAQKKYKSAKICLEKSISIYQSFYGESYRELADDYYNLANLIIQIIDDSSMKVDLKLKYAKEAKIYLYKSKKVKDSEKVRVMLGFIEFIIKKLYKDLEVGIKNNEVDRNSINVYSFVGEEQVYTFGYRNI